MIIMGDMMNLVPTVIERGNNGEYAYDIYSRLLKDRIIIINGEINLDSVNKLGICLILVPFLPSSLNNSLIFSLK